MPSNAGVLLGKMPRLDVLLPQLPRSLSATKAADATPNAGGETRNDGERGRYQTKVKAN